MESAEGHDAQLVARMASGDRKALASLYDRQGGLLLAIAQRVLRDRREAEDLLHDVFLEAWHQAGRYDPARGSVRAWLVTRMRCRALDRQRAIAAMRAVPIDEAPSEAIAPDDPSAGVDGERLRRALAALSPEQRRVLELGYFEGLSSSEIAARVEVPVGTVKSRVAAALARLRAALPAAVETGGAP